MNFKLVRQERIAALTRKLDRISLALKTYAYKNQKDILYDVAALEKTEKEIQIQKAYQAHENN